MTELANQHLGGTKMTDIQHQTAIRDLYHRFRDAVIAYNGIAAAPLLTRDTLVYFGELREIACQKQQHNKSLAPFEHLTVLSMQRFLSAAILVGGTNLDIMIALIDHGLFGAEIADLDVDDIDIVFPEAYAAITVKGQPLSLRLPFLWQESPVPGDKIATWYIHWLGFLPAIRLALKTILRQSEEGEATALMRLIDWRQTHRQSRAQDTLKDIETNQLGEDRYGRNTF